MRTIPDSARTSEGIWRKKLKDPEDKFQKINFTYSQLCLRQTLL